MLLRIPEPIKLKTMNNKRSELRKELNLEWAKPKAKNLKKDPKGTVIDTREPRDYEKINSL